MSSAILAACGLEISTRLESLSTQFSPTIAPPPQRCAKVGVHKPSTGPAAFVRFPYLPHRFLLSRLSAEQLSTGQNVLNPAHNSKTKTQNSVALDDSRFPERKRALAHRHRHYRYIVTFAQESFHAGETACERQEKTCNVIANSTWRAISLAAAANPHSLKANRETQPMN